MTTSPAGTRPDCTPETIVVDIDNMALASLTFRSTIMAFRTQSWSEKGQLLIFECGNSEQAAKSLKAIDELARLVGRMQAVAKWAVEECKHLEAQEGAEPSEEEMPEDILRMLGGGRINLQTQ